MNNEYFLLLFIIVQSVAAVNGWQWKGEVCEIKLLVEVTLHMWKTKLGEASSELGIYLGL